MIHELPPWEGSAQLEQLYGRSAWSSALPGSPGPGQNNCTASWPEEAAWSPNKSPTPMTRAGPEPEQFTAAPGPSPT